MKDIASRVMVLIVAVVLVLCTIFAEIDDSMIRKRLDTLEEKVYNVEEDNSKAFAMPPQRIYEDEEANADYEYIVRVITTEGGYDHDICMAVTQCLYNTCEKYDWKYTPAQIIEMYQYAYPSSFISEEALDAYRQIFLEGIVCVGVGEATIFYAPKYCHSAYHESQIFVTEINGVRFFKERD